MKSCYNRNCTCKYTGLFLYMYQFSLKFNNSLLFSPVNLSTFVREKGVPYCKRAEIIPCEPDAGNAAVGKTDKAFPSFGM